MDQIKKMMGYFLEFQFTDLLAFGNILGVQENDDFTEYVTNILDQFQKQNRKKRRQLLKLAKDVCLANKDLNKDSTLNKD